jgi:hypothetical protein
MGVKLCFRISVVFPIKLCDLRALCGEFTYNSMNSVVYLYFFFFAKRTARPGSNTASGIRLAPQEGIKPRPGVVVLAGCSVGSTAVAREDCGVTDAGVGDAASLRSGVRVGGISTGVVTVLASSTTS